MRSLRPTPFFRPGQSRRVSRIWEFGPTRIHMGDLGDLVRLAAFKRRRNDGWIHGIWSSFLPIQFTGQIFRDISAWRKRSINVNKGFRASKTWEFPSKRIYSDLCNETWHFEYGTTFIWPLKKAATQGCGIHHKHGIWMYFYDQETQANQDSSGMVLPFAYSKLNLLVARKYKVVPPSSHVSCK